MEGLEWQSGVCIIQLGLSMGAMDVRVEDGKG